MASILNVAAYHFVALSDPEALRGQLEARAQELDLKGTILLASEGLNLFLAGAPPAVKTFLAELSADARFSGLAVKESWSERVPFRKLRARVKREIIRMNHPTIRPDHGRAVAVDAHTLKRWLDAGHDDQGRAVVMLDTRNDFEILAGRFNGAVDLGLQKFSDFPAAIDKAREQFDGKTVVSYCTGGIRCEKAALFMNQIGLRHHFQLEGGILAYFEHVGGEHFEGSCTVFDERRALTSGLEPEALEAARESASPAPEQAH